MGSDLVMIFRVFGMYCQSSGLQMGIHGEQVRARKGRKSEASVRPFSRSQFWTSLFPMENGHTIFHIL